jgi:hypothetical protein
MREQARNCDSRSRWAWWLLVPAMFAALLGCMPRTETGTGRVDIIKVEQ